MAHSLSVFTVQYWYQGGLGKHFCRLDTVRRDVGYELRMRESSAVPHSQFVPEGLSYPSGFAKTFFFKPAYFLSGLSVVRVCTGRSDFLKIMSKCIAIG